MRLNQSSIPAREGTKKIPYRRLGLKHLHAQKNQQMQNHECLKTNLRYLISLMNVISLRSSSEKRHELVLIQRCPDDWERQDQVSIKLIKKQKKLN